MSWKLFDSNDAVLIQGITGKEGSRMARWLIASGVNVVGGVTPGKGGQTVEEKPVWNSVAEALRAFPSATTSCIVVPSQRVLGAFKEAVEAGVKAVVILTEQAPVHDVLVMRQLAVEKGVRLLGPSSVGYLQFPRFRLGYLGGESPFDKLKEGSAAVISTSGGMANEITMSLARAGIGVRVALALGGDRVVGTTLEEAVSWAEELPEVKSLIIFVEPGRVLLKALADGTRKLNKPTVVFLAGEVLDDLPRGVPYGHTGTILGEGERTVRELRAALCERGIVCVGSSEELITAVKSVYRLSECEETSSASAKFDKLALPEYIREKDFVSTLWLAWTGAAPSPEQRRVLEACLVACVDHGAEPPSARVARDVASCGKPLADSVAAGLLTLGPRHGNACGAASAWLREAVASGQSAADVVTNILERKLRVPGFGHPEYEVDPRTSALFDIVKAQGLSTIHFDFARAISAELAARKGKPLPLNVDGALGAIFADLGAPAELADALFIVSRTVGLIMQSRAQAVESQSYRRG